MSMFEDSRYRWRETYFVLFDAGNRPMLKKVVQTLAKLSDRYEVTNLHADDNGRFESLTLFSPDDFAALDICYTDGAEVQEQTAALLKEMEPAACQVGQQLALNRLRQADGRFDVLHFENISELAEGEDDESDEMFDPSALLLVLETLAKLTGGVAVDPQAGTLLSDSE